MPLPRFTRLPGDRRAEILRTAREMFAEHGPDTASYNKIIAAAGISKTAAYHYFDGREDLLSAVLDDLLARLHGSLGPWREAASPAEFWRGLRDGFARLHGHLAERPDDLALVDVALARVPDHRFDAYLGALIDNGRALGVIRADVDRELLLAATAAVFRVLDNWMLARPDAPADALRQAWGLLAGLWSATDAD
ncbi:TetR/AcrR family transcriptional regulator [Amycolatopsis anabasis]|uniref:TetR/AcrR family transcriptional regulator n=1 Tax=Amycolatopsis anabasis TaxID=1840409 RepID=UPI001C5516D0|nr:TetR/AcrR family transcriptional regulator [Amycolatopsis anabasis]